MATELERLYETDFLAWTQQQARALRELKSSRLNLPLDLDHLAEEVEDLGLREKREVRSQARRVIEHLLKLEYSAVVQPRAGWAGTILDARGILQDAVTEALRQDLEEQLDRQYLAARRKAALGLRSHGEPEAAAALPDSCPYRLDDILTDEWYPPNRHGVVDPI
jgi:DNA-binding PucR family transcriptional regulator